MTKLKFIIPEYKGTQGYITHYTIDNAMDISDLNIKDNMDEPSYITLDGDGLLLVGNSKQFYESGDVVGYISDNVYDDIADVTLKLIPDMGGFATNRILIEFYDGCCNAFIATVDGVSTRYDESNGFVNDICVFEINQEASEVILSDFEMTVNGSFLKIASISDGSLFIIDKVKSTSVHEEINILSDDLAINTFEASFVAETNNPIRKGYQLSVYNNNQYFGTFTVTNLIREDEFIYSLESENAIGTLDNVQCDGMPALMEIDGEALPIDMFNSTEVLLTELLNKATSLTGVSFISDYVPPVDTGLWSNWFYILGHIPVNTWRYAICACGWAIDMMVDGSRSDKVMFRSIPKEVTSQILTNDKRILGKAILEKIEPITKAIYMTNENWGCAEFNEEYQMAIGKCYEVESQIEEPQKYYFNDAPCVLNNIVRLPLLSEEPTDVTVTSLTTNCVEFKTTNETVAIFVTPIVISNNSVTIINENLDGNENANEKVYDQFKCSGECFTGTTEDEDTWNLITKYNNIKHFIESKGIVKARIILQNEKVGDLIRIETAWDGIVQGIIKKMDISFGINNIADIEVMEWNG